MQNLWSIRMVSEVGALRNLVVMTQSNFGFDPVHKKTCKAIFLEAMSRVVP